MFMKPEPPFAVPGPGGTVFRVPCTPPAPTVIVTVSPGIRLIPNLLTAAGITPAKLRSPLPQAKKALCPLKSRPERHVPLFPMNSIFTGSPPRPVNVPSMQPTAEGLPAVGVPVSPPRHPRHTPLRCSNPPQKAHPKWWWTRKKVLFSSLFY